MPSSFINPHIEIKVIFNHLPTLAGELRKRAGLVIAKTAFDIEGLAKNTVVVDTGNLKNSIRAKKLSDVLWVVEVGAEYGLYIEYGTVHMPARPYLNPAAHKCFPPFAQAMQYIVTLKAA